MFKGKPIAYAVLSILGRLRIFPIYEYDVSLGKLIYESEGKIRLVTIHERKKDAVMFMESIKRTD